METDFEKALAGGQTKEFVIALIFFLAGCPIEWDNIDSRQDIITRVNGRHERIEVKDEDNYANSGNICIERYQGINQKKYSGLSISESTVFIHTLDKKAVLYRTQSMRVWLGSNKEKLKLKNFPNADNGNCGYITPISYFNSRRWFDLCGLNDIPHSTIFQKSKEQSA